MVPDRPCPCPVEVPDLAADWKKNHKKKMKTAGNTWENQNKKQKKTNKSEGTIHENLLKVFISTMTLLAKLTLLAKTI